MSPSDLGGPRRNIDRNVDGSGEDEAELNIDELDTTEADPFAGYRYDAKTGFRLGPEHRERKGWFATDQLDRKGNPLWYKPPGFFNRWLYRISLAIIVLMAVVVLGLNLAGL